MNDKQKAIDWEDLLGLNKELIEKFKKEAVSLGKTDDEINLFLTTCIHLAASGRENELKSRLADKLRTYKEYARSKITT
ncbi:MAG: hypothetical protein WC840_03430 [Candidatus Peribacteraceae bacterium]